MNKILVKGGNTLKGKIKVGAAKNSVLPIIAATLLSDKKCTFTDVPLLNDVYVITDVLKSLGADVNIDPATCKLEICCNNILSLEPSPDLVGKMRASFLVMGPLLARYGRVRISLPGGCNIGTRPIDLHLKGLSTLGAEIETGYGFVEAKCTRLRGANVYLDFPSVGATENIMVAACLAEGETIIQNAAEEPEIVDLANFLNSIGCKVTGAGSDSIKIEGVESLNETNHIFIPDRIEAGTFMVASAITGGDVVVENVVPDHIRPVIAKLQEAGVQVLEGHNKVRVISNGVISPVDIKTLPYPGFPTDMQSQLMALMSIANGTSIFTETVFENRFMHVNEFRRMGADIKIDGRLSIVKGSSVLTGADVKATDLRAGAALILAGLFAKGETTISDIYHIERGYVDIVGKLQGIGANIEKIKV
ncbi:UDP-N-acetylglucosamine 1-carboxyvinyltransferase [Clostridium cylindrosporum]|uniref:UDP-N-acetylglucosamine 1-carboxyvinyltransferase n=1 Tax=Clostridium cylindrosporum DSM 605 TaxID=1121307 RepID=A0A0J8G530_CLOCY|nr:UDP-N-acetylglucosamine 1-carboxyvinyltransferase [Clostridium cylindrosporum]KMT22776.1 UDP-N-acetylglucosamine 1-carboxyvinyltransferase 2 [Clostridium cylindrosporum DSM 605]